MMGYWVNLQLCLLYRLLNQDLSSLLSLSPRVSTFWLWLAKTTPNCAKIKSLIEPPPLESLNQDSSVALLPPATLSAHCCHIVSISALLFQESILFKPFKAELDSAVPESRVCNNCRNLRSLHLRHCHTVKLSFCSLETLSSTFLLLPLNQAAWLWDSWLRHEFGDAASSFVPLLRPASLCDS